MEENQEDGDSEAKIRSLSVRGKCGQCLIAWSQVDENRKVAGGFGRKKAIGGFC